MNILQINTTQNVNVDFELANVGERLLAFILDNVVKFAYLYITFQIFSINLIDDSLDSWSSRAVFVLILLPVTFYSLYSEILMNGQTLGKKVMKIRVINIDGFKPSTLDYFIRWFMRIIDFNLFLLLIVYLYSFGLDRYSMLLSLMFFFGKTIGFFTILINKDNQRFGDMAAYTVVVSLKDSTKFSHTILEELAETYIPTYPAVIKLSDNDARIIKETFESAKRTANYKNLIKLRSKIEEVTGIKSQDKTDAAFIDKVLKDYNYYTQNM